MIKFEKVKDEFMMHGVTEVELPQRATKTAVAYDFYSPIDVEIPPKETFLIWSNVKATFPANVGLILCATSGMGKRGVTLANSIGVVESDYYSNISNDGNLGFRLYNFGDKPYIIKKGDKIGEGFFINFLTVTDEVPPTTVRVGGFGSTDKRKYD